MTVIDLLLHRNHESDTETGDHIMLFIPIIYKGVHHLHLIATLIEIQTDDKRQPFTSRCLTTMNTLHLHYFSHSTCAFYLYMSDVGVKGVSSRRSHKQSLTSHPFAVQTKTVYQKSTAPRDIHRHTSCVHDDTIRRSEE